MFKIGMRGKAASDTQQFVDSAPIRPCDPVFRSGGGSSLQPPYLTLMLKMNPAYPTKDVPRHRFEKALGTAPWSGTVAAAIELDDPAWELLGCPRELQVNVGRV